MTDNTTAMEGQPYTLARTQRSPWRKGYAQTRGGRLANMCRFEKPNLCKPYPAHIILWYNEVLDGVVVEILE